MPVCTPLEQGLSAQLLVEEGNGKPPHHHPSSHFPSLDDTGFPQLVSSRTCLTAEHLSSCSSAENYKLYYFVATSFIAIITIMLKLFTAEVFILGFPSTK